jgi:hypothetical protein
VGTPDRLGVEVLRNHEGGNTALGESLRLPPTASVARDGRAMVIYNEFAASRIRGVWSAKVEFSADELEDEFFRTSEAWAKALLTEAVNALPSSAGLPSFRRGTLFFDVAGVAVSVSTTSARAWNLGTSRRFPLDTVLRRGKRISEAQFRAVLARTPSQPAARH